MRQGIIFLFLIIIQVYGFSQEKDVVPAVMELQLENLAEKTEAETEDDSFLQQLHYYIKHPLNLNRAGEDELMDLRVLNGLQVKNLLSYRRIFGDLLSVYELQAIPGWHPEFIRKLLPYITTGLHDNVKEELHTRLLKGTHTVLFRTSEILEKTKGYQLPATNGNHYLGGANRMYMRYKYQYKNGLQWGLLGEKDGGEMFFRGKQKAGFDFYSFHVFVRNTGLVKSLAIGDFAVNMGQGLIQWQSMAFKKGGDPVAVKRQSAVLRPYNSAGEFNFFRGAGITLQKGNWETTAFVSYRSLTGNNEEAPAGNEPVITSFNPSGYHRTQNESAAKGKIKQFSAGARISYKHTGWQLALNTVHHYFPGPVQKQDRPYNLFAINGKTVTSASMDYSYTRQNMHFFGEVATDLQKGYAFLNGLLLSLDPKIDLSMVHRVIDKNYRSMYANAFTENTLPVNERGIYAGITIRPGDKITVSGYADVFLFPWLKYRVDAPSAGKEYALQLVCKPAKPVEISTRYRIEWKQGNSTGLTTTSLVVTRKRENLRVHSTVKVHPAITLRNRIEMNWYDRHGPGQETGFLAYMDLLYKPLKSPWTGNARLMAFETDGYNARLYAYENDVMYDSSIPPMFDKGFRYYLNLHCDIFSLAGRKKEGKMQLDCWVKWAQTIYLEKAVRGTGLESVNTSKKSEIRFQVIIGF
jgi:hypothetical protein